LFALKTTMLFGKTFGKMPKEMVYVTVGEVDLAENVFDGFEFGTLTNGDVNP